MRRRVLPAVIAGLAAAALLLDLGRPPAAQATARLLVGAIHLYREVLSGPLAATGAHCRFEPTCSVYAEAAILNLGAVGGTRASIVRLLRCGPWTPADTVDPPPGDASGPGSGVPAFASSPGPPYARPAGRGRVARR